MPVAAGHQREDLQRQRIGRPVLSLIDIESGTPVAWASAGALMNRHARKTARLALIVDLITGRVICRTPAKDCSAVLHRGREGFGFVQAPPWILPSFQRLATRILCGRLAAGTVPSTAMKLAA